MGVRAWLAAGLVAVVSFAVFAASPVTTVSDSRWVLPAAISLERHGDLDLDEYRPIIHIEGDYAVREHSHHTYYFFPYGTSVLISPVVWVADQVSGHNLEATMQSRRMDHWDKWMASLITALAAGVLFLVAFEVLGSLWPSLAAAGLFSLGTAAWSTATRALWMHGPDMLLLSTALLLLLASSRRPLLAGLAGLPLAYAFVVRPTSAAAIVCFGAWVAWRHRRQVLVFAGLGLAVAVGFAAANHAMFGTWVHPYYDPSQFGHSRTFWQALAGNLVSPGRGLFVFSPVLLCIALRRRALTPLEWAAAATVAVHLVLISRFHHWWGGYSYGPRLFSDMVPLLLFLLLPVLLELRRPAIGAVVGVLAGASVFVNARGALDQRTWDWNGVPVSVDVRPARLWHWNDVQFLRHWR